MKEIRRRIRYLLALLFLVTQMFITPTTAQNLDSLEQVFSSYNLIPAKQLKICDDLSWGYLSSDFEKSKKYALIGIKVAEDQKDIVMTGTLYRNLGVAYYMVSKLDTANMYFDTALKYAKQANDESLEAVIHSARANLYNLSGDYKQALFYYLKALPVFEKEGDKFKVRRVLGNIGTLYSSLQNFDQAEKFYFLSEKLSHEINDPVGLTQAYNGLGNLYSSKGDYEKALYFSKQAIALSFEIGDLQTEALSYQAVSEVYYAHYKDYEKAEEFARKGLSLTRELGFPGNISAMLTTLSNVYYQQGKYDKCMEYAIKAIETDTTDMNSYSNMAANVVRAGIQVGDINNSLKYFDTYRRIIDTRADKEYQSTLNEMEVKYEIEKKELRLLAVEKKKKLTLTFAVSGITFLMLVILILYFKQRSITHKRKLAENKLIQFEQEKKLIATQAVLEGETTERLRIASDLHDGLGGMLSVVKLKLINMKGNLVLPESDVTVFENALGMLDSSISELRRVALNLMPESLMRYGLKAALTDFCGGIEIVQLYFYGEERRYEEKLEVSLFRIAQELVNNAIKHSGASLINVQIIFEDHRINLVVQDNGKGFEVEQTDLTKTTGLKSIRSRVESLNGKLDLLSSPGNGTEVHVEFIL